jgi:hypothetical protein
MPSESDHGPRNAFTADFLSRLDEIAEPDGAHEADAAGPWTIRPVPYGGGTGFGLLREWESLGAGDVPYAVFRQRETALLAAAVLPATGREPLFRLDTEPDAAGFPLLGTLGSLSASGPGAEPPVAPPAPTARPEHDPASAPDPSSAGSARARHPVQSPPASQAPHASRGSDAGQHRQTLQTRQTLKTMPPPAGHVRDFDEGFAVALHLVAALVRSPTSLAMLLEAAGYVALEQAGRILHRRIH